MILQKLTKELKKEIGNKDIRKNVTKIYLIYDECSDQDYYEIHFKEDTVMSVYDEKYIERTWAKKHTDSPAHDINDWLNEIAICE